MCGWCILPSLSVLEDHGWGWLNIENSVLPVGVVYLICRYLLVPCFVVSVFIHYPDSGYRVFEDDSIRGKQRYFN